MLVGYTRVSKADGTQTTDPQHDLSPGVAFAEQTVSIGGTLKWELPVDVHLMVDDPEQAIRQLEGLQLQTVWVHIESTLYPRRVLGMIREQTWKAGIALNPATAMVSQSTLQPYLNSILMLTTEPERYDAPFLEGRLDQVREAAVAAKSHGISVTVDGGVNTANIELIADTGVDTVVVGRALFDSPQLHETVARIKKGGDHE